MEKADIRIEAYSCYDTGNLRGQDHVAITQQRIHGISGWSPDALAEPMRPVALNECAKRAEIPGAARSFASQKRTQPVHSGIYYPIVFWSVAWCFGINFVYIHHSLNIIPLCLLGSTDAALYAFYLLVHSLVWILPGVAHENGAHIAQLANDEIASNAVPAGSVGISAVLCKTQDTILREDRVEAPQVVAMSGQGGHRNSSLLQPGECRGSNGNFSQNPYL